MDNGPIQTQPERIFFDTNALRALSFEEIKILLGACRENLISVCICEPVIIERAIQHYAHGTDNALFPHSIKMAVLGWLQLFEINGAQIVRADQKFNAEAERYIKDERTYFSESVENDWMDALIFSMGIASLSAANSLILCKEKKLTREFENHGFRISNDPRRFLKDLTGDSPDFECIRPEIPTSGEFNPYMLEFLKRGDAKSFELLEREFISLPESEEELNAKLQEMQNLDVELFKKVMGYVTWFAPLSMDGLVEMLGAQFNQELIRNVAERLCIEGLLQNTGTHLIPGESDEYKEICQQSMALVYNDIVEELGTV